MNIEQIGSAGMQYTGEVRVKQPQKTAEKAPVVIKEVSDGVRKNNEDQALSEKQVQDAVDSTNRELARMETNLRFSIHKKTKQIMVKIIDTNTEEVIREIPPEKILDMVASMMERAGLFMDKRG